MTEKEEKLVKKIQKEFPDFYDSLQTASSSDLKEKLSTHAKHKEETDKFLEECVPLIEAKEKVKELSGPSKDTLKALKLRMKYIYLLMKEKGEG